jgi:hypothetical protein
LSFSIADTAVSSDCVGSGAERGRDGGLEPCAYGEQRGHRAQQPADLVGGGQERAGAVLAREAQLEGFLAGGKRSLLALGLL